jgi:hypothetical protein
VISILVVERSFHAPLVVVSRRRELVVNTPNGLVGWPDQINIPIFKWSEKSTRKREKKRVWGCMGGSKEKGEHD